MRLLIRFLIRTLAGFPLPRLLGSKDKQIRGLEEEVERLRVELRDMTAYNHKLVDSVLIRSGALPTEQVASEPRVSSPPANEYDDDQWERDAHAAEVERQAQMAAADDHWYQNAVETAAVDPEWVPVLMRANELRRKVS